MEPGVDAHVTHTLESKPPEQGDASVVAVRNAGPYVGDVHVVGTVRKERSAGGGRKAGARPVLVEPVAEHRVGPIPGDQVNAPDQLLIEPHAEAADRRFKKLVPELLLGGPGDLLIVAMPRQMIAIARNESGVSGQIVGIERAQREAFDPG